MRIETPSLTLRRWAEQDVEALVEIADDRAIWANMRDRFPHPYTRADAEAWIALCAKETSPPRAFAIEVHGRAAGGIGLELFDDVHRGSAEIGYWLGRSFWGHGLATEAVVAVAQYGFERLGLERIQAQVFAWNDASTRVLVKAGFAFEGRLRRHVIKEGRIGDALLYARVREQAPGEAVTADSEGKPG
jgi:RimJ/RimL family protein N-acetyltransferase